MGQMENGEEEKKERSDQKDHYAGWVITEAKFLEMQNNTTKINLALAPLFPRHGIESCRKEKGK